MRPPQEHYFWPCPTNISSCTSPTATSVSSSASFWGELKKKKPGELHNFPSGILSIGRLDEESEGLLLLPIDGKMSDLMHSRKIDKHYYAQVEGLIDEAAIA